MIEWVTVVGMLTVLAAQGIVFLVLVGLGQVVLVCVYGERRQTRPLTETFWIGFAAVLAFLQLWNLALPVDWKASVVVSLLGGLGLYARPRELMRPGELKVLFSGAERWVFLAVFVPFCLWVAHMALGPPTNIDSGLYHFNAVRWAMEYPVVPGLGNLHGKLAFNQSYFLYVALLNAHPYFDKAHHIANSVLVLVIMAQLLGGALPVLRQSSLVGLYPRARVLLSILCMALIFKLVLSPNLTSPSPDLSIFVIHIVLFGQLMRLVLGGGEPAEQRFLVAFIIGLAAAGVVIKLSCAAYSLAVSAASLAVWMHRHRPLWSAPSVRFLALCVLAASLVGVPWMLRGVLTSGYLAYPSTLGSFSVDWKMPEEDVKIEADWVYAWGRAPNRHARDVVGNWDWVRPWLSKARRDPNVLRPTVVFLTGLLAVAGGWILRRRPARMVEVYVLALPLLLSIVFWFVSAPDPRFAGASLWLLAFWTTTVGWLSIGGVLVEKRADLLLLALVLVYGALQVWKHPGTPGDKAAGFAPVPQGRLEEFVTDSGLKLYIPVSAFQAYELGWRWSRVFPPESITDYAGNQAWDSKLPATMYPRPELELRGETLREGFRLNPLKQANRRDLQGSEAQMSAAPHAPPGHPKQ